MDVLGLLAVSLVGLHGYFPADGPCSQGSSVLSSQLFECVDRDACDKRIAAKAKE